MKNVCLKDYFVSFKLLLPVEYEPQVTPKKPQSSPQVGLGFHYFPAFPWLSKRGIPYIKNSNSPNDLSRNLC